MKTTFLVSATLTLLLTLSACSENRKDWARIDAQRIAREQRIERGYREMSARVSRELAARGYARVGTAPDGQPLYMQNVFISPEYGHARVFYAGTDCDVSTAVTQQPSIISGERKP